MVEEEARSKAKEQPWKNIWAENGRDICQEAFPTGLTSARAKRSGYHPKNTDMKEGATLIRIHGALCLSSTHTPLPPIMYPFFPSAPHPLNSRHLSISVTRPPKLLCTTTTTSPSFPTLHPKNTQASSQRINRKPWHNPLLGRQRGLGWFCHPGWVFFFFPTRVVRFLEETGALHGLGLLTNLPELHAQQLAQLLTIA